MGVAWKRVKSRWCSPPPCAPPLVLQLSARSPQPWVPFRVASAFLAGIVLHTLLHFAVHSGQLRNDCRHRGNGRYAAGPSLFPQPKKEGHHRLLTLFHATPILSMLKCRIQDGSTVPGALTISPPMGRSALPNQTRTREGGEWGSCMQLPCMSHTG